MNTVHLITHQNWHRDELSKASNWTVDHSLGFDLPSHDPQDAWWLPQAQAVQLIRAVNHYSLPPLSFIAPTPDLLDSLPVSFTGRQVETMTVNDAVSTLFEWPELWWKLATAKHDVFMAEPRTHQQLLTALEELKLPETAWLQTSTALPEIISEYRFFIAKQKNQLNIMTSSGYLRNGVTVYDGALFVEEERNQAEAAVEALLDSDIALPPSFVVDVAATVNGAYILEFNPSWCSGWYDCDVEAVLETIHRGFRSTAREMKQWKYEPDAVLKQQYAQPERRIWQKG